MSKRASNLLLALGVAILATALALFLYERYFKGPDEAGAKAEIQRWYDEGSPGKVRVRGCDYVEDPAGTEFDRFRCAIEIGGRLCPRRPLFNVPHKDYLQPQNFPPQPDQPRLHEDRC
jgi:hypothetical protein